MNIVRRELKVHISHLCYILCTAAEDYYKNNKEKFDFIKYSIEDDRPKTFLWRIFWFERNKEWPEQRRSTVKSWSLLFCPLLRKELTLWHSRGKEGSGCRAKKRGDETWATICRTHSRAWPWKKSGEVWTWPITELSETAYGTVWPCFRTTPICKVLSYKFLVSLRSHREQR